MSDEITITLQNYEVDRLIFLLKKSILRENDLIADIEFEVDLKRKLEKQLKGFR